MRNGVTVTIKIEYDDTSVTPSVKVDPAVVEVEMRDPDGVETVWVYGIDLNVNRLAQGLYQVTSPPLSAPAGGLYTFIARGDGYPEAKGEVTVEASYW